LENPVAAATEYSNQIKSNRVIGNFFGRYQITDGLFYRASIGMDLLSFRELNYEPSVLQSSPNGVARQGTTDNMRWLVEHTLTFQRRFGSLSVDAVAGVAFQEEARNTSFVRVNDFPTDNFRGLTAGANPVVVDGGFTGDNLRSFFFNTNLNLTNRFILTGVFRADGSSRFINDQWGYFPGAALAWRLTEEDFFSGLGNTFSDMKLRIGYGQTGNNAIGNFTSRPLFGGGANYLTAPGIAPTQIGNPDLKWETTTQINFGLDFVTSNQRISGSIDYYIKETEDLLLSRPIPTTSGFASVIQNIGDMKNEGVELSLTTRNFVGDFDWSTTFNIGYNKNTVIRLFDNQPIPSGFANRIEEGQPLGSFYGYVTDGIFQNQGEVEAHASQVNARPGDIRFKDLNGDGVINDNDRTFIGKGIPDLTGGLSSNMGYKGFSLDLFFQFAAGFEIYNNNRAFTEGLNSVFAPTKTSFERAWR
jgi:TonB-linked SusC/RagA family outer membrane protein